MSSNRVSLRSLAVMTVALLLLIAAPSFALWEISDTSGSANCMRQDSSTSILQLQPGSGCYWQISTSATTDTDVVSLKNCGSVGMELNTAGTITVMPQSCESDGTNCNDMLAAALNGSTVGGFTQVGSVDYIKGSVTWTTGTGVLKVLCAN